MNSLTLAPFSKANFIAVHDDIVGFPSYTVVVNLNKIRVSFKPEHYFDFLKDLVKYGAIEIIRGRVYDFYSNRATKLLKFVD